jgi:hypothetical protein
LPDRLYETLPGVFGDTFITSTLLEERTSSDGSTTKLLFEMQDGLRVEVGFTPFHQGRRATRKAQVFAAAVHMPSTLYCLTARARKGGRRGI